MFCSGSGNEERRNAHRLKMSVICPRFFPLGLRLHVADVSVPISARDFRLFIHSRVFRGAGFILVY